ncbi:potassium channel family protein [Fimbriiglobus ruber]|uniref:Potassium channel protein n=1 Tax=Fimbriiglobus ruber TaxID=1908690 RepID=A0A225E6D8_9BACT|nr:NAD-binding protein [Fimbriiglobus ruber]OWK43997.1 Potassium channel protein [Fimbriiglobus ruber]
MERPVVLCGLGRVGWRVFEFLRAAGVQVAVLDLHASADDPRLAGVTFVRGDCRNPKLLEQVGVPEARGVLIVTGDDLLNISVAFAVRRLNPDCRIVVRMFNPNLIQRLGGTVRNMAALSVSALTAPLLAMCAVTGDSLGAFKLDSGPFQITDFTIPEGTGMIGRRVNDLAGQYRLLVFAHLPRDGEPRLLHAVTGNTLLAVGDRVIVCGRPVDLEPLLASGSGASLAGVLWAGWPRRTWRTLRRTLAAIDVSVTAGTTALFLTLFVSTLVFRFGVGTAWAEGLYQTVQVVATGSDLHGENQPEWVKVFLSILKIAGAALVAAFTAIFTNYLLRAKLGGAFELGKIPDGGHVVVCGLGNIGFRCVEELVRMNHRVVAIEQVNDSPFAATVRRMGVPVIIGDATVPEVLRQARCAPARAVIAATSSELANLEIALLAHEMNPAQNIVVRLTDPDFARAVRDAADIKLALSVPALAAPAFAAALYGDRVQTLIVVGGTTLAVVELLVQPNDPCLHETSLIAAMVDYRFLPVAVSGQEPFTAQGIPKNYRLKAGDTVAVVIEVPDMERLLRREPAAAEWKVEVDAHATIATEALIPVVRAARACSGEEAEALLKQPTFTLATGLTRGTAEELLARVSRERVKARVELAAKI